MTLTQKRGSRAKWLHRRRILTQIMIPSFFSSPPTPLLYFIMDVPAGCMNMYLPINPSISVTRVASSSRHVGEKARSVFPNLCTAPWFLRGALFSPAHSQQHLNPPCSLAVSQSQLPSLHLSCFGFGLSLRQNLFPWSCSSFLPSFALNHGLLSPPGKLRPFCKTWNFFSAHLVTFALSSSSFQVCSGTDDVRCQQLEQLGNLCTISSVFTAYKKRYKTSKYGILYMPSLFILLILKTSTSIG